MTPHFFTKHLCNIKDLPLFNHRLAYSSAISLILHLLVFFFFSLMLQLNTRATKKPTPDILEVSFAHQGSPRASNNQGSKIIAGTKADNFKIIQPQSAKNREHISAQQNITKPSSASNEVAGIELPGAIASPFSGQAPINNPFSVQAHTPQQQTMRNYMQQSNDAQVRARIEQQAQILMMQMQQMIKSRLVTNPAVTGKCKLIEAEMTHLNCDPANLHELIRQEERSLVGILNQLRNMGKTYNGFSIGLLPQSGSLNITLTSEAATLPINH